MTEGISANLIINILFALSIITQTLGSVSLSKRFDKRNIVLRVMRLFFGSSVSLCITYYIAMHVFDINLAHVLYSISIVFYNGLILFFFDFAELYTGDVRHARRRIYIVSTLMGLDAISVLVGIYAKHVITTVPFMVDDRCLFVYNAGPFHWIHYIISVAVVLYGVFRLLFSATKVPKNYRRRYVNIVITVAIVFAVNIAFHVSSLEMDLSGIIMPFAVVAIYYYAIVFSPTQFLRQSRAAVLNEIKDAILIFDYNGVCRDSNKAAIDLFGLDEFNIQNKVSMWVKHNGIDVTKEDVKEFIDHTLPGAPMLQVFSVPYYDGNDVTEGVHSGSYIRIHDRTEEIKRNREEMFNATHDNLTGLLNRDAFIAEAQSLLEKIPHLDHYLVCANIENFKLYNTLFGMEAGDQLLVEIGRGLESNLENYDLIGRMEADRFCVLMPRESFDEKLFQLAYVTALKNCSQNHYSLNTYIGVYAITSLNDPVSIMYSRTLMAAQSLKGSAEVFVAYYDQSITERIVEEQNRIDDLRRAIVREEFEFFIQPQVTAEGKVVGGEALVRWNHPQKGIVSPFFFIGLMEKHGMIASLDLMVWRKVCAKLEEWKKNKITDQYISVNISTKDFYYMDIYETFISLVEEFDIDRSQLKLEITESAIMTNEKEQISVIEKLRNAGFTIEMDDFGSGYSSLNMLNKMHVDVLKLDMGFLQKNADGERSKTILQNIERLAKSLNMTTIAEGVETKDQADFLISIGVDLLQGYLFSPPIPVKEYEERFIGTDNVFTIA